jgi:hypothetical protein
VVKTRDARYRTARRVVAVAAAVAALASPAASADVPPTLLTPGTSDPFEYAGASPDATTAFFTTSEQLGNQSSGAAADLYAGSAAGTRLIALGTDSPQVIPPTWAGSSNDGGVAFYLAPHFLDPVTYTNALKRFESGQTDDLGDGSGFVCTTPDGSHTVFLSYKSLLPADEDTRGDLYDSGPGGLTLLTPGHSDADGATDVFVAGHAPDCSRAYFNISESLLSADTNAGHLDVYSAGPAAPLRLDSSGGGTDEASYAGASADGSHVYFESVNAIDQANNEATTYLYERAGNTIALVASSDLQPGGGDDPEFKAASSDGSHVFFETAEPLVQGDADSARDVYERTGGITRLVSAGTSGPSLFAGASGNGARAFFYGDDHLYSRLGGVTATIGSGSPRPELRGVSFDGSRFVLTSSAKLTSDDEDSAPDVFISQGGRLHLISIGPVGGDPHPVDFLAASPDASRVIFQTAESLLLDQDDDDKVDLYGFKLPPDPVTPPAKAQVVVRSWQRSKVTRERPRVIRVAYLTSPDTRLHHATVAFQNHRVVVTIYVRRPPNASKSRVVRCVTVATGKRLEGRTRVDGATGHPPGKPGPLVASFKFAGATCPAAKVQR